MRLVSAWWLLWLALGCSEREVAAERDAQTDPMTHTPVVPQPAQSLPQPSSDPAASSLARIAEPTHQITHDSHSRLAVPFQENDGQWPAEVAFKADHFAGSLWVTRDGQLVYSLLGPTRDEPVNLWQSILPPSDSLPLHGFPDNSALLAMGNPVAAVRTIPPLFQQEETRSAVDHRSVEPPQRSPGWTLVERFLAGRPACARGLDRAVTNVSYFIGDDESQWAPRVSTFGAVSLWSGVARHRSAIGCARQQCRKVFPCASGRRSKPYRNGIGRQFCAVAIDRERRTDREHCKR